MPRYNNPVPQILDDNGDPIVGAKCYFYEPGTTTLKTVYSDEDFATPISNPVLSTSGGRMPSVFLNGVYKVVQKDADDVTMWTRDPVGEVSANQFDPWLSSKTYSTGDVVTGSDDEYYRSLQDSNQGNDPTSTPAYWEEFYTNLTLTTPTINSATINGGAITSKTVQASTSGTNIDFTDIPSWTKKIEILLDSVSLNTATSLELLLGTSGGMDTTADYEFTYSTLTNAAAVSVSGSSSFTRWRFATVTDANAKMTGRVVIENITGDIWIATGVVSNQYSYVINTMSGRKALGSALTQIRITANSNTFDAGQINVLYQ